MPVTLKKVPNAHLEQYYNLLKDPSLSINTGTIPYPITREWAEERLAERNREEEEGIRKDRGLYDGDTLVGIAGWFLNERDEMEIGYAVHKDHRGKGLATIAARLVIEMIREGGFDGPIYAQYFKDNVASGRVLEKVGFTAVRSTEGISAARGGSAPAWVMRLDVKSEGERS